MISHYTEVLTALENGIAKENILLDEPMKKHTTFEVGGPIRFYLRPSSVAEIECALQVIRIFSLEWMVIGQGSDLLFPDDPFEGVIIEIGENFSQFSIEGTRVCAQAGMSMGALSLACAQAGLAGFEFACGIPGTLGGGLYMNAGAYGGQISDVLVHAELIHPDGSLETLTFEDTDFGYRKSSIAHLDAIVLSVCFEFTHDEPSAILERIEDLQARRAEKQPLNQASGGSTFKRPEGHYASALIDEAGLKGFRIGNAAVSDKHAGFVVNLGDAQFTEVMAVIEHVQNTVRDKFQVELEPELRIVHHNFYPHNSSQGE